MRERLVKIFGNLAPTPIAWIAIVVGIFVHFIGFFLFRIQVPGFADYNTPDAYVSYIKLEESEASQDLMDQALLSDSVPLFLPSKFDYGWEMLQPSYYLDNQNSNMLKPFEHKVSLAVEDILPTETAHARSFSPEDLLRLDVWEVFRTLGERQVETVDLGRRFGVLEFIDEGTREIIEAFSYEENPLNVDLGSVFWRPAVVLVLIGTEGSLGAPLLRESTGIVALDQYVVQEVQRIANMRLVKQGYFRVVFGP